MATFVEIPEPTLSVSFFQNGGTPFTVPADRYLYAFNLFNTGSLLVDGVRMAPGGSNTVVLTEAWFGPGAVLSSPGGGADTVYIHGTLFKFGPI